MKSRIRSSSLAALTAGAMLMFACSDSADPNSNAPVANVAVAPPGLTLTVGQTGTLTAVLQSATGAVLTGREVTWTSSNNDVATVNAGVVTGVAAGNARITASVEDKSDNASISVTTGVTQAVFSSVAPGGNHTCALTAAGKAYCWGANDVGAIGVSQEFGVYLIAQPVSGNLTFAELSSGMHHTCGRTAAGAVYCWGWNLKGQLGDGTNVDRSAPVLVNTALVFTSITAGGQSGGEHTCGLTAAGAAYCWGWNSFGQLGDNTATDRNTPVPVQGGLTFASISAGSQHTCALTAAQKAYCWGEAAEVGEGTTTNRSVPTAVAGNLTFKSLVATWWASCGITPADAAYCWGFSSGAAPILTPTLVPTLTFAGITTGNQFTCGITLIGVANCWGANNSGQLGDGTVTARLAPAPVTGDIVFAKLFAGNGHMCGLTAAGSTYCWGANSSGQVGDATQVAKLVPVAVRNPF
jgi:alpha-tubulin suppressor-like RCC1 family protein